jgi:hypothetical protein
MGLIYDDPDLAALMLTRIAAEEADGPSGLSGHMHRSWMTWRSATGPVT